jgi:hypothetical protein
LAIAPFEDEPLDLMDETIEGEEAGAPLALCA